MHVALLIICERYWPAVNYLSTLIPWTPASCSSDGVGLSSQIITQQIPWHPLRLHLLLLLPASWTSREPCRHVTGVKRVCRGTAFLGFVLPFWINTFHRALPQDGWDSPLLLVKPYQPAVIQHYLDHRAEPSGTADLTELRSISST